MKSSENSKSLEAMYPFLSNKTTNPEAMNQALLNSIEKKVSQHQQLIQEFFGEHLQKVLACAQAIACMYQGKGRLFTMGNGGSSSDASHIAVEFLHPVTAGRPALPAFDLSSDKTLMTAIANDVGYHNVYSRQVENLLTSSDALVGVSTSGNSDNLVRAFSQAKKMGVTTIGLTGGNGGEMLKMGLDHCLVVGSDSIHRTQECHVAIYHILWDLVHTLLADERGNLNPTFQKNEETEDEIR